MTTTPKRKDGALPTELELRGLLELNRPGDVAALLALADEAPDTVAPLLRRIARATKSNSTRVASIYKKLITVAFLLGMAYLLLRTIQEGVFTFGAIGLIGGVVLVFGLVMDLNFGPGKYRVASHAALLLARMNHVWAIEPLANAWTPHPLNDKEAAFNADVSRVLTRLLVSNEGQWFSRTTERALRRVVERAFPNRFFTRWHVRAKRDWTEADTNLLLAIVRHLSAPPTRRKLYTTEPTADEVALQRVATAQPHGINAELLRDTARVLVQQHGSPAP